MTILRKEQNTDKFKEIKEVSWKDEKHLQSFFESNLETLVNLKLVSSEFTIEDIRLDTLAFDEERKSFVIIEYKKEKNTSVFDQGMSYLSIVLSNKAELVLKYNEFQKDSITKKDVNWGQTRVIIVNNAFLPKQIRACDFVNLPIQLIEVKRHSENTIAINPIKKRKNSPSILFSGNSEKRSLLDLQSEAYTEEKHTGLFSSNKIKEMYNKFRNSCLEFEVPLTLVPLKKHIAFKTERNKNAFSIVCKKDAFTIYFFLDKNPDDSLNNLIKPAEKGHWGTGNKKIEVNDSANIESIISLIEIIVKSK